MGTFRDSASRASAGAGHSTCRSPPPRRAGCQRSDEAWLVGACLCLGVHESRGARTHLFSPLPLTFPTHTSPQPTQHFTAPGAVAWTVLALGVGAAVARGWSSPGRGRALQRWTAAVAAAYSLEAILLMALSLHPDSGTLCV